MKPLRRNTARLLALALWFALAGAQAFDFADVAARAKQLAAAPYRKPESKLPQALKDLSYDQYRDIRFKPERAVWRKDKLPFELQFFHEGMYYDQPVKINEITPGGVREIRFDPDDFDYGSNRIDPTKMQGLGYAGFRVHYALNTPKYKDEVLLFLGASYFRALGKGQRYGLSARGLAIDTALASGEEFPRFTEFWIQRPKHTDKELTIYALLDSRRVTGAYRFVLKPGDDTQITVKERLYLRENLSKLGLAPLTSMYFFGENQHPTTDDYRPEVHDSDGLSIHSGTGEWLWRPLVNPARLLVTSFAMTNPQGFGLMQRDRQFCHYEDLNLRDDLRPSAWVEPLGQWGAGRVELVELPTPDETNDNIVAYWVPDQPPTPGQALDLEYRLHWQMHDEERPPLAWVVQTRRGLGYVRHPDGSIGFVVDFEGPALEKLKPDAKVEGIVSVGANGELLERNTVHNEVTGGWRLMLRLRRIDDDKPLELRAYLAGENSTLSETWSYILPAGE
ncbi:MAG: glucan biosynthesis protein G [Sinobacteraceae bacterium]|nr:glucan biosynthesis protein G [Nevskia sp.]MDI3259845.1 glucan biosynthesis protein G [Nevskiaceae bacterium]